MLGEELDEPLVLGRAPLDGEELDADLPVPIGGRPLLALGIPPGLAAGGRRRGRSRSRFLGFPSVPVFLRVVPVLPRAFQHRQLLGLGQDRFTSCVCSRATRSTAGLSASNCWVLCCTGPEMMSGVRASSTSTESTSSTIA